MLENRAAVGAHRRADQLAPGDDDLAARRGLEARHHRPRTREHQIDVPTGELGGDAEGGAGSDEAGADQTVGLLERGRQRSAAERGGDRVGELEVMQDGAATGRPPHHVDAGRSAELEVGRVGSLMSPEAETRRPPAVEAQRRRCRSGRGALEQHPVAGHVECAGQVAVEHQAPAQLVVTRDDRHHRLSRRPGRPSRPISAMPTRPALRRSTVPW